MLRVSPVLLAVLLVLPFVAADGDLSFSESTTECGFVNAQNLPCDAELRHDGTAGSLAPCSLDALGHRICVVSVDMGASATGHVMVPGTQELRVTVSWSPCCVTEPVPAQSVTVCAVVSDEDALSCAGHADLAIDFGPAQPWGPAPYTPEYASREVYVGATLSHEGDPAPLVSGPSVGTSTHLVARIGSGADAAAHVSFA